MLRAIWASAFAMSLGTALLFGACTGGSLLQASLVRGPQGVTASVPTWTAQRTLGLICPVRPDDRVVLSDEWREQLKDIGCLDLGTHDGPFAAAPGWSSTFNFTQAERMRPFTGRGTYYVVLLSPGATFVGPVPAVNLLMAPGS